MRKRTARQRALSLPGVSQVSQALHAGVIYRHIILTVPAMFRTPFYQNAAVVLSAFMRCGAQCLDDFFSTVRGKALRGGYITVLHTHGRNGQYHPHLHLLATSGGYDAQGARWEHLQYLPYELLRRKWQWHLLTMLRQTLKTDAVHRLVDACFRKYPDGLVTNVQKGAVPAQYQSVARYVAKYVVSPPIAVRRIDHYDGERVTYHYRSHRTDRMEHETVDVATFRRLAITTYPAFVRCSRYCKAWRRQIGQVILARLLIGFRGLMLQRGPRIVTHFE